MKISTIDRKVLPKMTIFPSRYLYRCQNCGDEPVLEVMQASMELMKCLRCNSLTLTKHSVHTAHSAHQADAMETILSEIELAIKAGLYYLAVAMALTLPDICAALESEDGHTTRAKYKAWYSANLAEKYPRMTDVDCYSLRCGVLHQGRCGHPNSQYGRVIFTIPNAQQNFFHNNIINDALNLDAPQFCADVVRSVREWFVGSQHLVNVQANLPNLVRFRPLGLPPYMVGMPLIA